MRRARAASTAWLSCARVQRAYPDRGAGDTAINLGFTPTFTRASNIHSIANIKLHVLMNDVPGRPEVD
jgi:hypothetical protein